MAGSLELRLLGELRVERNGAPVTGFVYAKARALLCYLAVTGRPHSREALATLLWSDMPEESARTNLRQVLSNLQKLVGTHLLITRDTVAFDRSKPHYLDVDAFLALIQDAKARTVGTRRRLREAVQLYRDFLEGFYVHDAPDFDDWAAIERERLRGLALEALHNLAIDHAGRGEHDTAAAYLQRLLELDSWREGSHRQLMLSYYCGGRRDAAIAQYHTCRRVLARELGEDPAEETTRLYQQIRAGTLDIPTLRHPPHNLPGAPTSLLGREEEVARMTSLLEDPSSRLLTLLGPGGIGKTRLALEVTTSLLDEFKDGAFFVSLAPVSEPDLVASEIAQALGVRDIPGRSLVDSLKVGLNDRETLLLLDNFEHLLPAAPLVAELLSAAPQLRVLVTSRAALRLRGEQCLTVPPLEVPELSPVPTPEQVAQAAAARLFVERARQAAPAFELTRENAGTVAVICRRLNGLPLAVELAAALVRVLTPRDVLARLGAALPLLVDGPVDLPERHRTMRATLKWSVDLLGEPERELFGRLSVFAGGFTLPAVETVGLGKDANPEAVVLLGRLVDHSLVYSVGTDDEEARYFMLEPVRQYAVELLRESGEVERTRHRHAEFFLSLAERAARELRGFEQVEWLNRLEVENDNLRAAVSWELSEGETETAARFGTALWVFWWLHGHQQEGRRFMEATLERGVPEPLRPMALQPAAAMAYMQADYDACERYCREAVPLSQKAGDTVREAYAWMGLALAAMARAENRAAVSLLQKSITLAESCGEDAMAAIVRVWLGTVLLQEGERERALALFEEGLAMARARGDRLGIYNALYSLSSVALSRGDWELADRMLREGITLSKEIRDRANLAYFLEGLAVVAACRGEPERSALLFGASDGLLEEVGAPVYNYYTPDLSLQERATKDACSQLGEKGFKAAKGVGQKMGFDRAAAFALED